MELTERQKDRLYERETHISYNELEENFEITTYDTKLVKRLTKNKDVRVESQADDVGTYYTLTGLKKDLNIDIYL